MRLNIIVGRRKQRLPQLLEELKRQGIVDYELWDGIYLPSVKSGINAAHRQIVEYAKLAEWEMVCIAEDDLVGTHENSWKYYLSQIPVSFDLYLSMIYLGDIDENNRVKNYTGMTLYTVHSRFYETFLNTDPLEHIDRSLDGKGEYIVCSPFTFIQRNGLSANTGKNETYDHLLQNRTLYKG